MPNAVVVAYGARLFLAEPGDGAIPGFPGSPGAIPAALLTRLRALPGEVPVVAATEELVAALSTRLDRPVRLAAASELARTRTRLPPRPAAEEREALLAEAHAALDRALRTPEEVLITLAREEERLERTVGREARAAESFLAGPDRTLGEYVREWAELRKGLVNHHAVLTERVRAQARRLVPNLSTVVGERTAARLVAEAGGVGALARFRGARIQLLGSRRRPSPDRGPRYGLLYRADGMDTIPPGRRGAYARSLAALAAIAIRADATTHASIAPQLLVRRDRRLAELRRRTR
ncbi:MAG TPA: hypothetical protein VMC82_02210 [Thermoplasmata archaeon]|nr:hypothetical protein [Thermoplasmata archaeon]